MAGADFLLPALDLYIAGRLAILRLHTWPPVHWVIDWLIDSTWYAPPLRLTLIIVLGHTRCLVVFPRGFLPPVAATGGSLRLLPPALGQCIFACRDFVPFSNDDVEQWRGAGPLSKGFFSPLLVCLRVLVCFQPGGIDVMIFYPSDRIVTYVVQPVCWGRAYRLACELWVGHAWESRT